MKTRTHPKHPLCAALAALAIAITTLCAGAAHAAPAKKSLNWKPTLAAALREARRTNKPVMIDFYATWCGPCKVLDAYVYTHPKVIRSSRAWVVVKVDGERHEAIAQKYRIDAFPTIIFLHPNGTVVGRKVGFNIPRKYMANRQMAIAEMTRQTLGAMNSAYTKTRRRSRISV